MRGCHVKNNAHVYGNAVLRKVRIADSCCVFGDAHLKADFNGYFVLELRGNCKFGGAANFDGLNTLEGFVNKYGADKVKKISSVSPYSDVIVLTDVWDMG